MQTQIICNTYKSMSVQCIIKVTTVTVEMFKQYAPINEAKTAVPLSTLSLCY